MEERNGGQDLFVVFTLVADLELVKTTVKGDATLDLVVIEDTNFGEFDVTVEPGGVVTAVVEFAEKAVAAIEDTLKKVEDGVNKAIEAVGEFLAPIIDSLDFIQEAWSGFNNGVNSLLSGDFAAAAQSFEQSFQTIINPENWEKVGEAVLETLEDVGLAINDAILGSMGISDKKSWQELVTLSDIDQWKCNLLRKDKYTERCWKACLFGCKVCDTDVERGTPFQNSTCVQIKKDLLEDTRAKIQTAGNYGTGMFFVVTHLNPCCHYVYVSQYKLFLLLNRTSNHPRWECCHFEHKSRLNSNPANQ